MAQLCIWLLDPFHVTLDGEPVTAFEWDKVRALLAYLAVGPISPTAAKKLAGLLWPEMPQTSARTNHRHALSDLCSAIGRPRGAAPLSPRQPPNDPIQPGE